MKATKSFKMSKTNKRAIAQERNAHRRGDLKALLIHAQLCSEVRVSMKDKKGAQSTPEVAEAVA